MPRHTQSVESIIAYSMMWLCVCSFSMCKIWIKEERNIVLGREILSWEDLNTSIKQFTHYQHLISSVQHFVSIEVE